MTLLGDQNIGGLHIAVQIAALVCSRQRLAHTQEERDRVIGSDAAFHDRPTQVTPGDVIHDEVVETVIVGLPLADMHDRRMGELRHDACPPKETPKLLGIASSIWMQYLDGNVFALHVVARPPDIAKAAVANLCHQQVAITEHITGSELHPAAVLALERPDLCQDFIGRKPCCLEPLLAVQRGRDFLAR